VSPYLAPVIEAISALHTGYRGAGMEGVQLGRKVYELLAGVLDALVYNLFAEVGPRVCHPHPLPQYTGPTTNLMMQIADIAHMPLLGLTSVVSAARQLRTAKGRASTRGLESKPTILWHAVHRTNVIMCSMRVSDEEDVAVGGSCLQGGLRRAIWGLTAASPAWGIVCVFAASVAWTT
jgi:hypothetical protein